MGFALVVRALPQRAEVQFYLESTWAKGKPLSCWTCLAAWGAIIGQVLEHRPAPLPTAHDLVLVMAATGIAGFVLNLRPIPPELDPPPGVGEG